MADITTGISFVNEALATCEASLADAIAQADARIGFSLTPFEASVATVAALATMENDDPYFSPATRCGNGIKAGADAVLAMRQSTEDVFIYDVCQCRQYGLNRDLKFVVRLDDAESSWEDNGYHPIPGAFDRSFIVERVKYWRRVAKAYFADNN